MQQEKEALLVWSHLKGMSLVEKKRRIEEVGSAYEALAQLTGWKELSSWQKDLEAVYSQGISLIGYTEDEYPAAIRVLSDAPLVLYVMGSLVERDLKGVAIVGTRIATLYGRQMALSCGREIAAAGYSVISGLARGIDTEAHKGALQAGRTVAVLGSGLGNVYPSENKDLAIQITTAGALISEFSMQAGPEKHHFPRRNRIVAALSQGVLLIEAPVKSGAMITMDSALSQGKKCFAIPGRADMETFKGNHALLKEQKARLVENGGDVICTLDPASIRPSPSEQREFALPLLEKDEVEVLGTFSHGEQALEEIAVKTKMPIGQLSGVLMELVLKQCVREFPGKIYKRV